MPTTRASLHAVENAIRQLRAEGYTETPCPWGGSTWRLGSTTLYTVMDGTNDERCAVLTSDKPETAHDITDVYM